MNFRIVGTVVGGNKIGRQLGFPTANVVLGEECGVTDGVYAVSVQVDGQRHVGMANVGRRPSVDDGCGRRLLEVNIFDFDGNLYGNIIEVELLKFFRSERRFSSLEELKRTVDADREQIKEYFKTL